MASHQLSATLGGRVVIVVIVVVVAAVVVALALALLTLLALLPALFLAALLVALLLALLALLGLVLVRLLHLHRLAPARWRPIRLLHRLRRRRGRGSAARTRSAWL